MRVSEGRARQSSRTPIKMEGDPDNNENNPNAEDQPSTSAVHVDGKFPSKTRLNLRIKNWNAVAIWKWVANDDSCGICRMAFEACCSDCNTPGDDCPIVWGACTHCFHLHCIDKWCQTQARPTEQRPHCPMCRQEWKEAVKNVVTKRFETV